MSSAYLYNLSYKYSGLILCQPIVLTDNKECRLCMQLQLMEVREKAEILK